MRPLFAMALTPGMSAPELTLENLTLLKTGAGWMALNEELIYDDVESEVKELAC